MKLHHAPISTCSQKVRLVLAEKSLAYDSEFIDLQAGDQFRPDYLALNPNGVVPTLEDQGRIFIESTLINEYLDDAYPSVALKPLAAADRHIMRMWCKRVDELHPHCGVQTYAIGVRPGLLRRPQEEVDALVDAIPDPLRREVRRSVIAQGVRAPAFANAYAAHERFFTDLEAALVDRTWLLGELFTLADAALLPYVLRVDHLRLHNLLDNRPLLMGWYERVCERSSYADAVEAFLPEALVAAFRSAGEAVEAEVAELVS